MAIPYQLSPLYQFIVKSRSSKNLPEADVFAEQLIQIEQRIISNFKVINRQGHPEHDIKEFINDHFLSLESYQDHLLSIPKPHNMLISACIANLKDSMLLLYGDFFGPGTNSSGNNKLQLIRRLRIFFKRCSTRRTPS